MARRFNGRLIIVEYIVGIANRLITQMYRLFSADVLLQLQNGLLMFPGVLMPLLDKCGINPDKEVSSHAYFSSQAQTRCV